VGDTKTRSDLPLDTRLLSEAIYELNISRHNVSIYPRNHPIVEKSLNQAYSFLLKLFELRSTITIAIAKDTLIIDDNYLDKQNPVYTDFARCLSQKSIASLTFTHGLTKEELYAFHRFLLTDVQDPSSEHMLELLNGCHLTHIQVGLIDYSAFSFSEGELSPEDRKTALWEQYVYGLLEGKLATQDSSEIVRGIPPEKLAAMINRVSLDELKDESYDSVITSYVKKSKEKEFSGAEIRKLTHFIDGLRPELKNQFLSSFIRNISHDTVEAEEFLKEMSIDEIINLLHHINEQMPDIPEALKNVLEKFAKIDQKGREFRHFGNGLVEDDILLSPEITNLLSEANFKQFVSEAYQNEILHLLKYDAGTEDRNALAAFEHEWKDEHVDRVFHEVTLELLSSEREDIISQEDFAFFMESLREQSLQLIYTGQYKRLLKTLKVLHANISKHKFADADSDLARYYYSDGFISRLIDSFRAMGKEARGDAFPLCEHYGDAIIPPLMDVLIDEQSQSTRRFFLSLLTNFRERVIPETLRRLEDDRWFVKRNMLFILMECGNGDELKNARPCCDHENPKVSFEAIKCLLKAGDHYGVTSLRRYLNSESQELAAKAVMLAGSYRVRSVVPDLVRKLRRKAMSGSDYEEKIPVVRALGQIGDPGVLDILNRIQSSRSILFKGSLEKLKGEIRNSLKNYGQDRTGVGTL
jgi:hypothetical protein